MISVIVPVYNAEKYLSRCIDSILAQSYKDFELLLIDDGSKDGSATICDNYAIKDSRVRVFHKANGGVSSARNLGLDNATGEWITFIDSDDYVESEYLKNFTQDSDLSLQGYYNGDNMVRYEEAFVYSEPGAEYLNKNYVYGPYCKLFRSKIIKLNNIRFDEDLSFGEDILFCLKYMLHAYDMHVSTYVGYHYVIYDNSLSTAKKSYKDIYDMYCKHIPVFELILKNNYNRRKLLRKYINGVFFHFVLGYNKSISDLRKNVLLNRCFLLYMSNIDRFFFSYLPCFLKTYRRFLYKYL